MDEYEQFREDIKRMLDDPDITDGARIDEIAAICDEYEQLRVYGRPIDPRNMVRRLRHELVVLARYHPDWLLRADCQ